MKQRTLWAASCGSVSDPDSASGGSKTVDLMGQPAASDQAG
ncbi:hypothetical protein [Streptomyces sp. GESEQ-4]|nr:hypothetical protein [Streptomyces sp. GESEQ-4]